MITKILSRGDYTRMRVKSYDFDSDPLFRRMVNYADVSAETHRDLMASAKSGDLVALRELIHIHGGLVEHFARRAWASCKQGTGGFGIDDLRQEARLGLVRAIQKFDPSRGVKFSTYAAYWIRSKIGRCISNQLTVIHVPVWARHDSASQRKHKLRTSIREAVEAAAMPTIDVDELPISAALTDDSEQRNQLRTIRRAIKHLAMQGALTPRDVEIVMRRYTSPGETLLEVGKSMNLTRERVRQLEEMVLAIIRFAVLRPDIVDVRKAARRSEDPKRLRSAHRQRAERVAA